MLGQHKILFNKKISTLRDQWIICPQLADGSYQFGFVFEDKGGVTFRMEGAFTVGDTGNYLRLFGDKIDPRPNISDGQAMVSILPYDKYDDLKITPFPEWYEKEGHDGKNVFEMYTEGYVLCEKGEFEKALAPLSRAYALNPDYRNLRYEYGRALNNTGKSREALLPLSDALKLNPESYLIYMEISLARIKLGHIAEAQEMAEEGIKRCALNSARAQMCINIAVFFFEKKDKKMCTKWLEKSEEFLQEGGRQEIQVKQMMKDVKKWD